jgi:tetratricopeptide (TPR) repeat protein
MRLEEHKMTGREIDVDELERKLAEFKKERRLNTAIGDEKAGDLAREGIQSIEAGDIEYGAGLLKKAFDADQLDAQIAVGRYYKTKEDYEKAEKIWQKVADMRPDGYIDTVYWNLGLCSLAQSKWEKAEEMFDKVREYVQERHAANLEISIMDAYRLALAYFSKKKEYASARNILTKLIEAEPRNAGFHAILGRTYLFEYEKIQSSIPIEKALEYLESAESAYNKALELEKEPDSSYYGDLGLVYYHKSMMQDKKSDVKKAVQCFEKAMASGIKDSMIPALCASMYERLGKMRKAKKCYQKAAELGDELAKRILAEYNKPIHKRIIEWLVHF